MEFRAFYLPRNDSQRYSESFQFRGTAGIPSELTICSVYSVFRGIIFLSEISNPRPRRRDGGIGDGGLEEEGLKGLFLCFSLNKEIFIVHSGIFHCIELIKGDGLSRNFFPKLWFFAGSSLFIINLAGRSREAANCDVRGGGAQRPFFAC